MYGRQVNIRFGGPLTPIVKKLLIINGIVYILQLIINSSMSPVNGLGVFDYYFALSHYGLIYQFKIWQVFTYMFLHGGPLHIIFNLLVLWMFGGELENLWGSKFFLRYYLFSGVGAGFFIAGMNALLVSNGMLHQMAPTLGASGAIYGLLIAYGVLWPNREVYIWGIFPVKVKFMILGLGLISFFGTISSAKTGGGGISHIGHLGGLVSGFIYLRYKAGQKILSRQKMSGGTIDNALKKRRLKKKQQKIEERIKAKKIIDELLEKIARNGMSSLTVAERKKLDWARRHYYPEGNDTVH